MKNIRINIWLALTIIIAFSACQEEESSSPTVFDEVQETTLETDINGTLEDIDDVILNGFQRSGISDRTLVILEEDLCEKVIITWLPNEQKMTLDFGEGCTSPRGITRKGKIHINYTGRYWVAGTVITTTFENFFINDRQIEGVRILKNEGFNSEMKFFTFSTRMEGGKITWPDDSFRSFESRRMKRIYLPNGDRGLYYAITGVTEGVTRAGNTFRSEILEPLIFAQRCINQGVKIPSKGILRLQIVDKGEIRLNFGSELCDREVEITRGDRTRVISIPRN